jgi:hypothetical protein
VRSAVDRRQHRGGDNVKNVVFYPHPAQIGFLHPVDNHEFHPVQSLFGGMLCNSERGTRLVRCFSEVFSMSLALSPLFWDKKFRIAILTLATFIALC